jgi:hypothetical protein
VYRLPTEAEWEYSCRGGRPSQEPFGIGSNGWLTTRDANFGNQPGQTCKVGSYAANALGLHDMHDNVWEWCADWNPTQWRRHQPLSRRRRPVSGSAGRLLERARQGVPLGSAARESGVAPGLLHGVPAGPQYSVRRHDENPSAPRAPAGEQVIACKKTGESWIITFSCHGCAKMRDGLTNGR